MNVGLVVPCYNESARWNHAYWDSLFGVDGISWLLVDDGSTDQTSEILGSYEQPNVHSTRFDRNVGKGEAVRQGLLRLLNRDLGWVGFVDADGAFTSEEIRRFVDIVSAVGPETQAVWSSRVRMRGRRIERSASRHAVGRTIATALSVRYRALPYDSQAGLKFFRTGPECERALSEPFRTRWLFDVELYSRLEEGFGEESGWLWEEPLDSWQHVEGSKISSREAFRIPVEILRLIIGPSSRGVRK